MNDAPQHLPNESFKVAFIFTSPREDLIIRMQRGQDADTALHGFNYFEGADYFVVSPKSIWSLRLIPRLLTYDFVIAQDNLLLGYIVSLSARIFRLKTRWLYVAINSSMIMRHHVNNPIRHFLLKLFWTSYARIICLSHEQLHDFARLGIPKASLVFIPFGVDTHFFQPTASALEEELIISVGRDAGRDYETLFRSAKNVDHSFVVVTGQKNIPSDRPIPSNVTVLYNRSLEEVRDLYRRARLVVVASKDNQIPEGSDCSGQTVVLDALASGKTVIATRRFWIADYLTQDQDLVVVEPNDPEALSRAINSLWDDAERRQSLAISGHDKVIKKYTTKTFATALISLMDSLI